MTMMVKNKHGVEIDCTHVADLWHIAMSLSEPRKAQVLEVWNQAHAMHDALHRQQSEDIADTAVPRAELER